jgi:predicted Rossmann fold flavoprotein
MERRIIIIGGGASGMMAAARAGHCGCNVVLLERKERLGNKLRITGKGRCNVTNMLELDRFVENYGKNGKFLYGCLSQFFNTDLVDFFEERGVKMVVERGKRVFPESSNAQDIVDCLVGCLEQSNITVKTDFRVRKILTDQGRAVGVTGYNSETVNGDAVIIATGGKSYPGTGSTGDGYALSHDVGHSIVTPKPGLVPIETEERFVRRLQGISLKNVELSAFSNGKKFHKAFGEMLFTHFGVSGPIVLTMSQLIASEAAKSVVTLSINLKPALSKETLIKRITQEFSEHGRKQYKNVLRHLLPGKAIPLFIELSKIPADKRTCEITREERRLLIELLIDFKLTVRSTRPISEAIVTSGGVTLKEINPKTMESKLMKGLFFAGEVIDVDGNTGGYNLQAAFSTGYVAGESACQHSTT